MKNDSIALGFFDGLHIGHAELLSYAKNYAEKAGGKFYATTFTDEISAFTAKKSEYITTFEKRRENLEKFGAIPAVLPSDENFFEMSPREFVQYIMKTYEPSCVVCGENFRFGKNRSGDARFLQCVLENLGVDFKSFPLESTDGGETISTTFIKNLIKSCDFGTVDKLMLYPYTVSGIVLKGTRTGTALGFPTANIVPETTQFLPDFGVYAGVVETETGVENSIINVGCRPTFGDDATKIECHFLYDFSGKDYYGQKITVGFSKKLRDIVKFDCADGLKEQLNKDRITAMKYFRGDK